jgi:hypothetical protein
MSGWWYVLPGVAASIPATIHTLWLRIHVRDEVTLRVGRLDQMIEDQCMHALQLWPRPWLPDSRPLTQAEQIIDQNRWFQGMPYPPEDQIQQMQADAQHLLDSYRPERHDDQ